MYNVLVTSESQVTALRVNGKIDASDGNDMSMQLGLAYFPRFFRPESRDVLVIGFGSGTTTGASLAFPETHVTVAEIEPAIIRASEYFEKVNHQPLRSPTFALVSDDGRHFLQTTRNRYDMILSEPSNPWMMGVSNLFTREFYETVSDRLNDGGILGQWIQCYALTPKEYSLILRTVRSVFPFSGLVRLNEKDTILIASRTPLSIDERKLNAVQLKIDALPTVHADLSKYFGTPDVRSLLLQHYIVEDRGLQILAGDTTEENINTDVNLRLEFDAPRYLFNPEYSTGANVSRAILDVYDTERLNKIFYQWGCSAVQLPAVKKLTELYLKGNKREVAKSLVNLALDVDADSPYFLATSVVLQEHPTDDTLKDTVARICGKSPVEASRIGVFFWRSEDFKRAVTVFEEVVRLEPNSATSWANLGVNYNALGNHELAERAFVKSMELDPVDDFVVKSHSSFFEARAQEAGSVTPDEPVRSRN